MIELNKKKSLYSLRFEDLKKVVEEYGEKGFRAKQIVDDLYKCKNQGLDDFRLLPNKLILKLKLDYTVFDFELVKRLVSADKKTFKYLFLTSDNKYLETVLMKHDYGNTVCVSSQVGCRMGCNFCASTVNGLERNLLAYEIIEQIAYIQYLEKIRVSNIVMMGMGEPLDNFDEVLDFIKRVSSEDEFNISIRKITVSTCGIAPKIRELADKNLQINLALSLHNPFNHKRREIMPVGARYSVQEVMASIDYYVQKTGRRVSIEYTMIDGENDGIEEAKELTSLLKGKLVHVNLIALNAIEGSEKKKSSDKNIKFFKNYLSKRGINVTLRKSLGQDIDAACGQLRASNI